MQRMSGLRIGMLVLAIGLAQGCVAGAAQQPAGAAEMSAMAAEWAQLRQAKGHFAGAEWQQELDAWQGRKHLLMQALGENLLAARSDMEAVLAVMGEPDAKMTADQADYADWQRRADWQGSPGPLLWSYHWRGQHDQLLLAFTDGRVSAVGWLYAWE